MPPYKLYVPSSVSFYNLQLSTHLFLFLFKSPHPSLHSSVSISVSMTMQVKKEAAEALAHLMVGEAEFPYSKLVLEALPKGLKVIALPSEVITSLYHILKSRSTLGHI